MLASFRDNVLQQLWQATINLEIHTPYLVKFNLHFILLLTCHNPIIPG